MKLQSKTKKILFVAAVVASLAIVGTVVGVVVVEVKKNRQSNATSTPSDSNSSVSGSSTQGNTASATSTSGASSPVATDFPLDPNLHKSFYGLAYTPKGAIMPECGANIADVRKDMEKLSQLTTRLRLYGSDCNVTSLVLQAIDDLKVDVQVFPGIYLEREELSYTRQKRILEDALTVYGTSRVLGVTVGNDNAGDTIDNATTRLVEKMNEVRTDLTALNFNIPVGTSETGGGTSQTLADNADYIFANIHPWFSSNTVEQAATFANNQFTNQILPLATASTRTPPPVMYQGEYGWPSGSDTPGDTNSAGSAASLANLQLALDDWVCAANRAGTRYWWFEPFDATWKATTTTLGVEPHWGLFDGEGNLKDITIPDCVAN
ncbi:Probable glucan endo-1,3-beta-glucosidase btgC; AltName: Full=Endo-1,3-beta-glucanase btgC; AltName: Full=Laminarinase btgC [Serendipita indica DSM 11827]|nr:Probable glucan endo-1,3-beta-glucosidase btgC; AltName: Full=Endo-1,3-beta-glucanase btgC; AltName: Full=Laminarinase btgC [Serendipita indica DSM 11827]